MGKMTSFRTLILAGSLVVSMPGFAELKLEGDLLRQERLAFYYWGRNDVFSAMEYMQPLAEKGHVESMRRLGDLAYTASDFAAAAAWYEKAQAAGDVPAAMQLALLLESTYLGEPDGQRAFKLVQWAAEQGSGDGMEKLADYFISGRVVPASAEKALEWLRRAAEMGRVTAWSRLAEVHLNGTLGLAKDEIEGKRLLMEAENARVVDEQRRREQAAALTEVFRGIEQTYLGSTAKP